MTHHDEGSEAHDCNGCPLIAATPAPAESADVTRRHFVSVATLSAIALTLSACGGGELSAEERLTALGPPTPPTPSPTTPPPTTPPPPTPPPPTTPPTTPPANPPVGLNQIGVTVASFPALLAVGGVAKVNSSPPVALARTATGFVAYSLRCPHAGTTVNLTGSAWVCPNHKAQFSGTGTWTGGETQTTNLVARMVTPNATNTFVVVNLT